MPIPLRTQSQSCQLTGVGDVILDIKVLRNSRTLELAAALVQGYDAGDRPGAFLSLVLSRAAMKPFWTFEDAASLPGSAREEAVKVLIVGSPYREAFNALPVDSSAEERLYGLYRDQLEAVVVTPELGRDALKRRDLAIHKDLYAETLARAALPAWVVRENQAAALLANSAHTAALRVLTDPVHLAAQRVLNDSVHMAAQRVLNDSVSTSLGNLTSARMLDLKGIFGQVDQSRSAIAGIAGLNNSLVPATEYWAKPAYAPLVDLMPRLVDTFRPSRYAIEEHLALQQNAYQNQMRALGTSLPSASLGGALEQALRLGAISNPPAWMSGLSPLTDPFAKQAEIMGSAIQGWDQNIARSFSNFASAFPSYSYQVAPIVGLRPELYLMPEPPTYISRERRIPLESEPEPLQRRSPNAPETNDGDVYRDAFDLLSEDRPDSGAHLEILLPLLNRLEHRVRLSLRQQSRLAGGRLSNGRRIVEARGRFNEAWSRAFPACKNPPLRAEEEEIAALFYEVHDPPTFSYVLGCLEIVSSDGGLDQTVLDVIAPRTKARGESEKPLKQLQRALHEVIGLVELQARELMSPFFTIRNLRNGLQPMHRTGSDGRKAFASIGHPLPLMDPAACWEAVTDMYVEGLNRITDVIGKLSSA